MVIPRLSMEHRLHRGCGRSQDQQSTGVGNPIFCDIPGVIAGRALRFVACLLFLIQYNESQMIQRRENGRSGANHYFCPSRAHPFPFIIPFPGGKHAVEQGDLISKLSGKQRQKLRRQSNLRH